MATVLDPVELRRRFTYHKPADETRRVHDAVRYETLRFAEAMNDVLAASGLPTREAALFFTALEEASFWAHAHVARNMPERP